MRAKLRVVRHRWPSLAMPGCGTVSLPAWMAAFAAVKKAAALQAPTWVKAENWPLMSSPATQLACCSIASGVPDAAGTSPVAGGSVGVPVPVEDVAVAEAVVVAVTEADGDVEAGGDGWWCRGGLLA